MYLLFIHFFRVSTSHQAPGEAEAELAQLNVAGVIDAVLTNDSDTLVFGACCIIRKYVVN